MRVREWSSGQDWVQPRQLHHEMWNQMEKWYPFVFSSFFTLFLVKNESMKIEWDWVQPRQLHHEMWTMLGWKSRNHGPMQFRILELYEFVRAFPPLIMAIISDDHLSFIQIKAVIFRFIQKLAVGPVLQACNVFWELCLTYKGVLKIRWILRLQIRTLDCIERQRLRRLEKSSLAATRNIVEHDATARIEL